MELINRLKHNFTINYHDYDGNTHFVKIPFKFLQKCPNKCYLMCLLKYKNMYGWNVVDDYLLAWFHENLTGECGIESNALEGKGDYAGLWKFKDILCNGVRTKLVNKATRLPHGWIWVKSPNNPHMRILKFRFTDENFYKIEDDDVGVVTTFNFYDNYFQKICGIKELEPRRPYYKAVADSLELSENDKQVTKIINKSIRKSKKTFARVKAFGQEQTRSEDCLLWVQKERKINFIRKINTTEGFWKLYLDDEKIPSKVFNIEGYRLFCTCFPRPFIPPSIENNRWVRLFTSVETVGCTQAYDTWILQSDLKKFYKHMIISGEGRALVECLGLHVDNTPERVRAANIIKKFYKGNRMKKGQFNILSLFKRTTSIENPEEDEESEDEWETNLEDHLADADDFCKTMSKKLKREKSEEERQMQLTIENAIANDKNIINLKKNLQRVTSLHNSVSNRVNMINKYIIGWEKTILGGNEKKYFHIWWFLCFGKNFFTHYKGNVVGGKKKFYKKDTAKYLAEGDMIFIFEDKNLRDCINHFQSLVKTIKSTLKIWKNLETTEKIGYTHLSNKQKKQAVKTGFFDKQDKISKEHAYEDLSNIMNDSAHLELYFGIGGGGSYADALSLLKNLPDIKTCCIQIVKGFKKIVKEKETFIKGYLKDINELNDMITIQKELIKDSYKY